MKIKNSVKMKQDLRIWSMRFTRMYRIKRLFGRELPQIKLL